MISARAPVREKNTPGQRKQDLDPDLAGRDGKRCTSTKIMPGDLVSCRLPQTGDKGIYLKQQLKDKLIEHKQYIDRHGEDLPEIRNWKWSNAK